MDAVLLRPLEPKDVDAIVQIAIAAWRPIYEHYRRAMGDDLFETAHPDWREDKASQVRRACASDSTAWVSVAQCGDRIVGFITFYADPVKKIGTIGNNAVDPEFQGQGIGPMQYEYVFERLRDLGMCYVRVNTGADPSHAPARRAYEKAGFQAVYSDVTYYRAL